MDGVAVAPRKLIKLPAIITTCCADNIDVDIVLFLTDLKKKHFARA